MVYFSEFLVPFLACDAHSDGSRHLAYGYHHAYLLAREALCDDWRGLPRAGGYGGHGGGGRRCCGGVAEVCGAWSAIKLCAWLVWERRQANASERYMSSCWRGFRGYTIDDLVLATGEVQKVEDGRSRQASPRLASVIVRQVPAICPKLQSATPRSKTVACLHFWAV